MIQPRMGSIPPSHWSSFHPWPILFPPLHAHHFSPICIPLTVGRPAISRQSIIIPISCEIWVSRNKEGILYQHWQRRLHKPEILFQQISPIEEVRLLRESSSAGSVYRRSAEQSVKLLGLKMELAWDKSNVGSQFDTVVFEGAISVL